jgi:hypothetical protein
MPQYLVAIQHPENYDPSLEGEAMIRGGNPQAEGSVGREIDVAGPNLAGSLTNLGPIDEYRLYIHPIVLDSGQPFFARPPAPGPRPPAPGPRPRLRLAASDRTGADVIRLRYITAAVSPGG